ncbi:MAG: hypothetical protein U5L72_03015 [Bacteroidales bacterium]|nr:hypothetical protein [Bacteroidales bacterium]
MTNMVDVSVRDRVMASKAGINMLKADVYLWTAKRLGGGNADLTSAQTAAEAVLADPNYGLTTTYEEAFSQEQNKEIIFSIYFTTTEGSQNQYGQRFTYQSGQVKSQYRNNPVPIGSSAQWHVFNDHYVNDYLKTNPGDSRAGTSSRLLLMEKPHTGGLISISGR